MKKTVLAGVAALSIFAIGCKGNVSTPADLNTPEDSLAYYVGQMYGFGFGKDLASMPDSARWDKNDILKGLQVALAADTTQEAYLQGIALGLNLQQTAKGLRTQEGISIDNNLVYKFFKEALKADSVGDPQAAYMKVNELMQRIHVEKIANSPEAVANKNAGAAYIAEQMKKDPSLKKTESGLVYKVIAEGEGKTILASDRVKVKYTGKHIDGKEFDTSGDDTRTFSPTSVVKGFGEGLKMMKPGAHYVLYIPGDLAYGVEGRGNIGPNETLVFDVEVVGIEGESGK